MQVTRRGRRPQASQDNTRAKEQKNENFSKARATRDGERGTVTWTEPPTDAELLGRGKLDPNLPLKE